MTSIYKHRFTSVRLNSSFKNISVQDFSKIINGPDRSLYQIVDVREKGEFQDLALYGDDVLNLPISDLSNWGGKVVSGELLDASKPVLCMCKLGGRSAKAAEYLGMKLCIPVYCSF